MKKTVKKKSVYLHIDYCFAGMLRKNPLAGDIPLAGRDLVWLWRKDESIEHADYSMILNAVAIIWIACAIAATPYMINSSKVVGVTFKQVEILDKERDENSYSGTSYYVYIEPEDKLIHSKGFSLSKQYYDSIDIGDKVPVCVYTGILGKQFYSFFEDPDKDYYGYNRWTREEYRKYRSEQ